MINKQSAIANVFATLVAGLSCFIPRYLAPGGFRVPCAMGRVVLFVLRCLAQGKIHQVCIDVERGLIILSFLVLLLYDMRPCQSQILVQCFRVCLVRSNCVLVCQFICVSALLESAPSTPMSSPRQFCSEQTSAPVGRCAMDGMVRRSSALPVVC
jgi:hypothetical protein